RRHGRLGKEHPGRNNNSKSKALPTQCPARSPGHYGSAAIAEPETDGKSIGIRVHCEQCISRYWSVNRRKVLDYGLRGSCTRDPSLRLKNGSGRDDASTVLAYPLCPPCPLWLRFFQAAGAGTESRRGWCGNRS